MSDVFCCLSLSPYRPKRLDHELKFSTFMEWSRSSVAAAPATKSNSEIPLLVAAAYVVQVVRQKNFGALQWKRYFAVAGNSGSDAKFHEVTEKDLIDANFEKLNSYKNFKCVAHDLFFEVNLYQKKPVNSHHWRANIARPASTIDLPAKHDRVEEVIATAGSAALQSPMIKSEPSTAEAKTLMGEAGTMNDSEENMPCNTDPEAAVEYYGDFIDEDGENVDDDYLDRREVNWSPSSGEADDFTACSAHDCGYCGKCSY